MRLMRLKSGRDGTLIFLPTTPRERGILQEVLGAPDYRMKVRAAPTETA